MKNNISKIKPVLFISALVLLITFTSNLFIAKTTATSQEQMIISTLEQLDATDAVYIETIESNGRVFIEYHSNSTGYTYTFLQSTGVLWSIDSIDSDNNDSNVSTYSLPLSDSKRRDVVMEFVSFVLNDTLIGQLDISNERDAGYAYKYTIKEYYNDMETGTAASVTCSEDGTIRVCNFTFGNIFMRNKDGSISLRDASPFIGEEAALEIALDAVDEHASERGNTILPETATTTIRASENLQYYEVLVDSEQPDGYVIGYVVCVDVHSGEITFFVFDQ